MFRYTDDVLSLNNFVDRIYLMIFHSCQPSQGDDRHIFEVMTPSLPNGTIVSIASVLAPLVEHDLQTLLTHLISPQSLVDSCYSTFCFIYKFCRSLFFLLFFFLFAIPFIWTFIIVALKYILILILKVSKYRLMKLLIVQWLY
jgi:hypothetical protein